jgi:hypothetical protein
MSMEDVDVKLRIRTYINATEMQKHTVINATEMQKHAIIRMMV